jgi:hypothetical protein
MAEMYCPCEHRHKLWGEFWWTGGKYRWVFFDDRATSETYAEQVESTVLHAAGCSSARIL